MPDDPTLIDDAQTFYRTLADNNSRDWWIENKAKYDNTLKAPALDLLSELTPKVAAIADMPVTTKLFRPHRDVRFSKDKTPYNTHLHMMWALESGAAQSPVFFFGIGLDYVSVGAGIMGFDKPMLDNWRKFTDLDTDRIMGICDHLTAQGATFREPALKRVPSPYDKDHKAAHLLRMKGVVASQDLGNPPDLSAALVQSFNTLWPLNALLIQVAES